MKLVELVLEIRFNETAEIVAKDLRFSLAKKILPEKPLKKKNEVEGIKIEIKEKKTIVEAQENRFAIVVQHKNQKRTKAMLLDYLDKITKTIDYSGLSVARVGIKSTWLIEASQTPEELKSLYASKQLNLDAPILSFAVDYSINLTLESDPFTINYLSGPVKKGEILQGVNFGAKSEYQAAIMATVDCYILGIDSFNSSKLIDIVDKAISTGIEMAEKTKEGILE